MLLDPADETLSQPRNAAPVEASVTYSRSPMQLHAAASLYGIEAAPLAQARVLQLDCGAAGNLIAFALAYPQARVVGIDSSAENIEAARARAAVLGLVNLDLRVADWMDPDLALGQFDCIVACDMYGRMPAQHNAALLRFCAEHLVSQGIACVDYRTYPGWKAADILRDAMMLHSHGAESDALLIGTARGVLGLMSEGISQQNPNGRMLQEMVKVLRNGSDEDLVRNYLLGNPACYYIEFADASGQAGLACAGDSQPHLEMPASYGNHVGLNHSLIALGKSKVVRQQYLDFAVGRQTRRTLLVRAERAGQCLIGPDMQRLRDCRLAASLVRVQPGPDTPKRAHVYRMCSGTKGGKITVEDPVVIAVIDALSHAWPGSMTFDELVAHTLRPVLNGAVRPPHEETVGRAIEYLFQKGVLRYSVAEGPYERTADSTLRLLPNVRAVLAGPNEFTDRTLHTYNLWGEPIELLLADADRHVLPHMTEGADFGRVVEVLLDGYRSGAIEARPDGGDGDDRLERSAIAGAVSLFDRLKAAGLLSGTHEAWQAYFSASVFESRARGSHWQSHLNGLLLHARFAGKNKKPVRAAGKNVPKVGAAKPDTHKDVIEFKKLFEPGLWLKAAEAGEKCTAHFPRYALGWHLYGDTLRHCGKLDEALVAMTKAAALDPENAATQAAMGVVMYASRLYDLSETAFRRALLVDPDSYSAHVNLSVLMKERQCYAEAEAHSRRGTEVRPHAFEAYTNLSNVLSESGKINEAIEVQRHAMTLKPDYFPGFSNLLFTMTHADDIPADVLRREHLEYGAAVEKRVTGAIAPHRNSRDPERRLKVGFVSADLRDHAVANFLEPVWAAMDHDAFEIYAYSNHATVDAATERLRAQTKHWRTVIGMTDAELVRQVRDDEIDILFDLSGHTAENRLPAFAYKPAPIQVSWIGYSGTTGMKAMDYFLVDQHMAPPGYMDEQFVEKLVYVPAVSTFKPFAKAVDVNELPALTKGYVTFGSFNRPSKVGDYTLDLWARVLNAVPDSRMLMGAIVGNGVEESLTKRLGERGVAADRLLFRRRTSMYEYMKIHHEVDIVLDTFPYTGGTTSNHALWMGVPVLTIQGRTRVSCQSSGVMRRGGMPEWVTESPDDFVNHAVAWTKKLDELARIRSGMREHLRNAPNRDAATMTRGVEAAMRQMWRRWCAGQQPESFKV
jgi:predicted O-linked N-acetylglucosamine transferase (SPINDLY family)